MNRRWLQVALALMVVTGEVTIPYYPARQSRAAASDETARPSQAAERATSLTSRAARDAVVDAHDHVEARQTASARVSEVSLQRFLAKRSIAFEKNQGQTDPQVKFLARGAGYTLFLTATEAVLALRRPPTPTSEVGQDGAENLGTPGRKPNTRTAPLDATIVRMKLVGANPSAAMVGSDELPGKINYFKGSEAERRFTNIPAYARITYGDVYPGVDLVYYGDQGQLEYDFVLAAGADPGAISLAFEGVDKLEVDARGDLVLHTAAGEVRQPKPVVYQDIDGIRQVISGDYVVKGLQHVGVRLGSYDPARPLVIDPLLVYSTYLGGNNDDVGVDFSGKLYPFAGIAVDAQGNVYVTGTTASTDFPTGPDAHQAVLRGNSDVFVTKLDANGALVHSTYLGGPCDDSGGSLAVDAAGNAYVTGRAHAGCQSPPAPPGVLVAKLSPTGALLYFFTFGESLADASVGRAIAVDAGGHAYVTGSAASGNLSSRDFPTTPGAYQERACPVPLGGFGEDGFVAKVDAAGNGFVYSTLVCGSDRDSPNAIAIDTDGNAYIAGSTRSRNFPTVKAFQDQHRGGPVGWTGFVTKLNAAGSSLVYSTYLGGSGIRTGDFIRGIAVDAAGNAYVIGDTGSGDFPTTAGVLQPVFSPSHVCSVAECSDAFVTKFDAAGALVYSTYLYGEGWDEGNDIDVDAAGNAYVTGWTASVNFPIVDAFQPINKGNRDAFVAKLNPTASELVYSSYLGGSRQSFNDGRDNGLGIAVDAGGNAVVAGSTISFDFPTTPGALKPNLSGNLCAFQTPCSDAFVTKIAAEGPGVVPDVTLSVAPTNVPIGGTLTATWAGIPRPSPQDRLSLAKLGTFSDEFLTEWPTTGEGNGSLELPLPNTLPPGVYELRLRTGRIFSPITLARSSPVRVAP